MIKKLKIKAFKNYIPIISIFCVFVVSGIVAYLMDSDYRVNNFVVGNVKVQLHEDHWNPTIDTDGDTVADAVKIRVNQTVEKDPQIENIGDTDAFVYLKLYIPKGTYEDGLNTVSNDSIISYQIDTENWVELEGARCTEGDNNIYVYCYKSVLPPAEGENISITPPLFDSITLKTVPNGDEEEKIVSVKVEAYAMDTLNVLDGTTYDKTEMAIDFIEEADGKRQNIVTTTKVSLADCTVTPQSIEMYQGGTVELEVNKINEDLNLIEELVYTSSDYNVVNVNQSGNVTGVKPGNAIITVTGRRSGVEKNVNVLKRSSITSSQITADDYGKYVNLGTDLIDKTIVLADNTTPLTDWRVFKADSNGTWLILADFLPQNKMPDITNLNKVSGKTYIVNSTDAPSLLGALQNTTEWKALINGKSFANNPDVIVKGAFTKEEFDSSANDSNQIGKTWYLQSLYISHSTGLPEGCTSYWLVGTDSLGVLRVAYDRTITGYYPNCEYFAVRPCIYLPASIGFDNENEIWTIVEN